MCAGYQLNFRAMHACTNKQKIPKKGKTKTPKRNEKEIKKCSFTHLWTCLAGAGKGEDFLQERFRGDWMAKSWGSRPRADPFLFGLVGVDWVEGMSLKAPNIHRRMLYHVQMFLEHICTWVKEAYDFRGYPVFKSASELSCSYSCPRNFLFRCADVGFFWSLDLTSPNVLISSFLLGAGEHTRVRKNEKNKCNKNP